MSSAEQTPPPPPEKENTPTEEATGPPKTPRRRKVTQKKNTLQHASEERSTTLRSAKKKDTSSEDDSCSTYTHPEDIITASTSENNIIGKFARLTCDLLGQTYRTITWPLKWVLMMVLPHTLGGILTLTILITTFYLLGISLKSLLERVIFTGSIEMVTRPLRAMTAPVVYLYCSILRGPFCSGGKKQGIQIGQVARTVSGTAQQASDIFDSVVQLSDPSHLGLYQTEILELAFAVRWSSDLHDKSALADGLNDLSDLTRQLKDHLIDLNGKGLNTFSFVAYQFSRLGDLIEWVQSGKKAYTTDTIKQNLDILFEDLSRELSKLLSTIEGLIPLASRSTNLGMQISERLHRQHYQLKDQRSNQNLWKKLLDLTAFQGRQLNHDLDLTAESIKNLRLTWVKLEDIRTDLLTYRNNVANFKASFTGWHLADHGLTPEDELLSMRQVIEKFQLTLKTVKSNSRPPSPNLLSNASP